MRMTNRGAVAATGGILLVILAGVALTQGRRAAAAERRVAQLSTEALLQRTAAAGWQAQAAVMEKDVEKQLRKRDDEIGELARELRVANARLQARVSATATATGHGSAPARTFPRNDSTPAPPDSVTGRVRDGLIDARLTYLPGPAAVFRLVYQVQVPLEIVTATAADGRGLAFARSPDPRVRLAFDTLQFQSAAGGQRPWRWLLAGAVLGVAGWESIR